MNDAHLNAPKRPLPSPRPHAVAVEDNGTVTSPGSTPVSVSPSGGPECPRHRGLGPGSAFFVTALLLAGATVPLSLVVPGAAASSPGAERAALPGATRRAASPVIVKESITFIDYSRSTPARGSVPMKPERILLTDIRRPARWNGRLGVVIFAHGWNSNPTVYEPLLDAWAAAGYLVAAPVIPSSSDLLPGTPISDYWAQARDESFVLTRVLERFAGVVDPKRIAFAGHSDGGTDVALLALNPAFADHRARAYLSLSGEIPSDVAGPWTSTTPGALLVAVGTEDQYGLYPFATAEFNDARMTKAMIVAEGGDHIGIYVGASPEAVALRAETVRFLNTALGRAPVTASAIGEALEPSGSALLKVVSDPA